MKLSQTVAYAVHAALCLAENPEASPVSCKKVAEQGKMPERFLLQILRHLAKKGILESTRGGRGGFVLARRPDEISLLEVIEAVEGPMVATLPASDSFPRPAGSRLSDALLTITETIRRELQAVKLSDLVEVGADSEETPKKKAKRR